MRYFSLLFTLLLLASLAILLDRETAKAAPTPSETG